MASSSLQGTSFVSRAGHSWSLEGWEQTESHTSSTTRPPSSLAFCSALPWVLTHLGAPRLQAGQLTLQSGAPNSCHHHSHLELESP